MYYYYGTGYMQHPFYGIQVGNAHPLSINGHSYHHDFHHLIHLYHVGSPIFAVPMQAPVRQPLAGRRGFLKS